MIESFDVLIVAHSKDFQKLSIVIDSIKSNIVGYNKIHIICNSELIINDDNIVIHDEKNILNVEFDKLKYRPNWIYQQLLKLLQKVTQKWFLVIDSDTIITKKLFPIANGNPKFYFNQNEQNYEPYFKLAKKLKVRKKIDRTFISEIMMFNRDYIDELFSMNGLKTNEEILNFMYKNINENCHLSEYELYGNFIEEFYPEEYEKKEISSWGYGRGSWNEEFWNQQRIKVIFDVYGRDYDLMSFHTYK